MLGFNFWHKWLLTVSFSLIIFGLAFILFNQSTFFNFLFNSWVNAIFWNGSPVTCETMLFQQWIYSVLGAVIAGWGTFMTYICTHSFRNKERWSWNCFMFGILIWFIADTSASGFFHVYINVIFNIVIFIAFFLPLIFTRKYFA